MSIGTKSVTRRGLLGSIAMVGAAGCGWILYPERNGRRGGEIDGRVLLVDIIWLLPGLIPGIICLAVDFSTGCIYGRDRGWGSAPNEATKDLAVEVHVDGQVVGKSVPRDDGRMHFVWNGTPDMKILRERGRMIALHGDVTADAAMSDLI